MASTQQLQQYLAAWFQLGKAVTIGRTGDHICPRPVFRQGQYSPEFLRCWHKLESLGLQDCYLDGTVITLEELNSSVWEINACARCLMPIAQPIGPINRPECPCTDLPNWPNFDLPIPHPFEPSNAPLQRICDRIATVDHRRLDNQIDM